MLLLPPSKQTSRQGQQVVERASNRNNPKQPCRAATTATAHLPSSANCIITMLRYAWVKNNQPAGLERKTGAWQAWYQKRRPDTRLAGVLEKATTQRLGNERHAQWHMQRKGVCETKLAFCTLHKPAITHSPYAESRAPTRAHASGKSWVG